jgi:hypothetical protein
MVSNMLDAALMQWRGSCDVRHPLLLLLLLHACRHTKHRQERVMKELSAAVPAPVDIEELAKIGRHAEV